ncbi:peptide-binding protein [Methylomonas rosea]|uniref:Peptide-binding protein n=1 Tax=Methylomonas rosea TaxID=2952227 RepID=A0ABT1TWJ0_9GAMM|nr:peptide-binding protein [Methylomonas sp. WSC-7]MCQ8119142.1 peptide-binding protein [Methylomonas sp. WSC-7]
MQTPSTTRDWILYSLLSLTIVLIVLAMYQIDRQWLKLSEMQSALSEQAKDMRELRGAIASGAIAANASTSSNNSGEVAQAFQRAYAASRQPDYAQGDWSVEAFGTNLKTITPLVSSDAYASNVQSYVLESLIIRNPDTLEWEGLIAKDWTISEDGLVISFRMREDVSFSDGQPLTAADVVFSFDFIMTDAIQAPRERAYLEKVKSVKANGKYEVVFTFKEPYFEALSLAGGIGILPKHFYEPYLQEPQKFNESKGLLLGSGPYRLNDPKNWTPDKGNIELVRNERYWGDVQPSYHRILWKIIQNDSARLTTFRNGDIDSYSARPVEYQELKKDPQIQAKSQNFEYMPPVVGYSYIGWNQERGGKPTRFADKRVRQAMTYLTDVGRVIKDVMLDYAEPAVSPFSKASKQHDAALQPYQADLDKAKALLKDAGYQDKNGDGVLEDKAGAPFEFKLTYFQANEDTKRMVLLLKDLYARAGVKLIPTPQEWPVMLENLDKKDFDAITLGWTSGIETDLYQIFHSSQAVSKGDNYVSYKNPALDKLIDDARRTVDESKRMPLWQQAERILYEDQPYTFLMRRKSLLFVDKRIHNLQMTKLGLNFGGLPLENYVPLAQQKYTQ